MSIRLGAFSIRGWAAALCMLLVVPAFAQEKIVVATGLDPTFANFASSVDKGFFKEQGIDAELRSFDDGNVALDALLTGQADIGATSELGGIARVARGGKIYAVGSGIQSADFFGVVGSSTIQNPKDFEGKNVGVPKATGAHLFMGKYFAHHDIDQSKVNIRFLQAPESVAALARGDIDAFFLWDPWLTRATETVPDTHIIARSGDNNVFRLNTYIWFSERLINNKKLAERALKALVNGSEWAMANRREASEIAAKYWHLDVDFSEKMASIVKWDIRFLPEFNDNMRDAAGFAIKQGVIDKEPDYATFLRPDIMEVVDPVRLKAR
ncbi:ABC transporter substrate-binding protein [Pseudochelatococcus sp. B33]